MKVLAVDYGSKRVGLASGDSIHGVAFPKGLIVRKSERFVIDEILKLCEKEGYKRVVFGLPLDMDGGKGRQYQFTERFVDKFKCAVGDSGVLLDVSTVDERLSSFEAEKYLCDFDRRKVRKGDWDVMAAKVILERYFSDLS